MIIENTRITVTRTLPTKRRFSLTFGPASRFDGNLGRAIDLADCSSRVLYGPTHEMKILNILIKYMFQMLLNLHCNDNMNFNDGSCCKSSDVPSGLQKFTFYLFLSW